MKAFFGILLGFVLIATACTPPKIEPDNQVKEPAFNIDEATVKFNKLKDNVAEGKKKHKFKQKLREEIGMKAFNGAEVEVSQAELFYDSSATVHVEVIYFNVVPLGLKRWYFENEQPIAVEVCDYVQAEDASLEEKKLYRVLIAADDSAYEFPNPEIDLSMEKQAELVLELVKERKILKDLADKYRPK